MPCITNFSNHFKEDDFIASMNAPTSPIVISSKQLMSTIVAFALFEVTPSISLKNAQDNNTIMILNKTFFFFSIFVFAYSFSPQFPLTLVACLSSIFLDESFFT